MLAVLSSAIVFWRAPKNQHAFATLAANPFSPYSIPRNGVTQLSLLSQSDVNFKSRLWPVTLSLAWGRRTRNKGRK